MKRSALFGLSAVVLAGFCSGCVEMASVVKVNKDGSGSIVVTQLFSPMVSGMLNAAQGMGSGTNGAAAEADPFKADALKKVASYGAGVEMAKYEPKSNAEGWKGYEATYSFKDINRVNFGLGDMSVGGPGSEGGEGGESAEAKDDSKYRFKFTPGSPAELQIVTSQRKKGETAEKKAEAKPELGAEEQQMMAMMIPMFKGMHVSCRVQVNGEITQTNAKFRSAGKPGEIVLADVPFDKLIGNPEIMKLLTSKAPGSEEKAKALAIKEIPGLQVEEDGKTVSIKFK
jgi:hypothetical protein